MAVSNMQKQDRRMDQECAGYTNPGSLSQTLASVNDRRLAAGLGWFGIGLGLAEVATPDSVSRLIGAESGHRTLVRLMGAREIISGAGILTSSRQAGFLWSRVAGDVLDLALLGAACESRHSHRGRVATAIAAVAGVTILDILCSWRMTRRRLG